MDLVWHNGSFHSRWEQTPSNKVKDNERGQNLAGAIILTHDRVSTQSNHEHFLFQNYECEILDKPLSHVDTTECYSDLLSRKLKEELLCCYTRTRIVYQHFLSAFPMIQTQQEDREWKQQVDGLQNKLQTFTKQREVLRQQVETLQQYLFLLKYNLMWHACRYEWDTFNKGGNSNSGAQRKRLFHPSTPNTTSALYGAQ